LVVAISHPIYDETRVLIACSILRESKLKSADFICFDQVFSK